MKNTPLENIVTGFVKIFDGLFTVLTLGTTDKDFVCDYYIYRIRKGIEQRKSLVTQ